MSGTEKDPYTIAERQLQNLAKVAPDLSKPYLKRLKEMPQQIEMKSDVTLTKTMDAKNLYKPTAKECEIKQVVIRRNDPLMGKKRFLISSELWAQLDAFQQAGMLTHEIIYEHLYKLGEHDSVKARKLNSYIYSQELRKEDFWNFIKDLQVPIYPL